MFPLMTEVGQPMMEYLNKQVVENGVKILDAQERNHKYTIDLFASVALGTKTNSFFYPYSEFTKTCELIFHHFS